MNEFFTWGLLGTFAGAAAATGIFTQFVKNWLDKIPTQIVSYIIAVVVLSAATAFTGGDLQTLTLVPFNAIIVSTASNGSYEAITRIFNKSE